MSRDVLEKENPSNVVPSILCPDSVLPRKQRAELLAKKKVAKLPCRFWARMFTFKGGKKGFNL